jgi:flagellin
MSTIQYNYAANVAANALTKNEKLMDVSMARLSSGTQVGIGANEPGVLGSYSRMRTDGMTARAGLLAVNQGLASLKLVESQAMKMHEMLVRMQALALASTSTSITVNDRYALDAEFFQLGRTMDTMTTETTYNGTAVMQGTDLTIFTGGGTNFAIAMDDFRLNSNAALGEGMATGAILAATDNNAAGATSALDFTTGNIQAAAGDVPRTGMSSIAAQASTANALAIMNNVVPRFSEAIGRLGGQIAALEHAAEAMAGKAVAFEAAASTIGDTDYATETSKLASAQIISQAATSILAQANTRASTVLTLLQ